MTTARRVLILGAAIALVSVVMVQLRKYEAPAPAKPLPTAATSPRPSLAAQPASPVAPEREVLDGQPALNPPTLAELSTTDHPPLGDALGSPKAKPEDEPAIVLGVLDAYLRIFRTYPAGENNRQFVNALLGANKEKLPFIALDHPRLNANGELVDAWSTPFFFHQNSRTSVEVRSAGPDRLLYTNDDIVAGKTPSQPKQPTVLETPMTVE